VSRCDEKRLSVFHGFHVNSRREGSAPRLDHVRRIEGRTDRANRINVSLGDGLSISGMGLASLNFTRSHDLQVFRDFIECV
jgi:hypothetical protein